MVAGLAPPHAPIAARACRPEAGLRRGLAEYASTARRRSAPSSDRKIECDGFAWTEEGAYSGAPHVDTPRAPARSRGTHSFHACALLAAPLPHYLVCGTPGLGEHCSPQAGETPGTKREEDTLAEALPEV